MIDLPPFPGFRPEAFAFLRSLAAHNDRDWFKPRKALYDDEVVWPLQCLLADAAREGARQGLPFAADPARALFRIYRDTRFSKDKRPYKTHAGAVLSRSGSKDEEGVVYVHVEPGQSFLGAGYWQPEAALLRAWRARLATDPGGFLAVRDALAAAGLTVDRGDALKRMPRGYEALAEHDVAPFLRARSFTVRRAFPDEALQRPAFTHEVLRFAHDALPLLAYGWALEGPAR